MMTGAKTATASFTHTTTTIIRRSSAATRRHVRAFALAARLTEG
jgi:hypothetical protein